MKTQAAIIDTPDGDFRFRDINLADPAADEVLVRLEACGVCHTDVSARVHMQLPAVLGHEGSGEVVAVGSDVSDVKPGDKVIMSFGWCGTCGACESGHGYVCERSVEGSLAGRRFDGSPTMTLDGEPISGAFFQQSSFAHYAITPARDVVVDKSGLAAELRAALPCGVMTGAGAMFNTFKLQAGQSVAVFGAGAVGLAAIMAAKILGADPIVAVDINPQRLALALELGATHALQADDEASAETMSAICPTGFNYSLETSSHEAAFQQAVDCLGVRGTCGLVTVPHAGQPFPFSPFDVLVKCLRIEGIMLGSATPRDFLPQLIDYHRQGQFPFDRLVKTYDFKDINAAFAEAATGAVIKPVLTMPKQN